MKRLKVNEKEAGVGPFYKYKYYVLVIKAYWKVPNLKSELHDRVRSNFGRFAAVFAKLQELEGVDFDLKFK